MARVKQLATVFFILAAVLGMAPITDRAMIAMAQSEDTNPPTRPGGVTVTQSAGVPFQTSVSWTASTDVGGSVAGYYVFRNGGFIGTTAVTSMADILPSPGSYSYVVSAFDAAGNVSLQSYPSQPVSYVNDTGPPSAPGGLSATSTTSTITISWSPSTDDIGVVGYYIYKNGSKIITTSTSAFTGTSYRDSDLVPGVTYGYRVVAYDSAGNTAGSGINATTIWDVTPPNVPSDISVNPISSSEIDLIWLPSWDNVAVVGYYIYRDGSNIANVTSTTFKDLNLAASKTYNYSLAAYDAAGNVSSRSYGIPRSTFGLDISPPTAPRIVATPISPTEIDLVWGPSYDNVGIAGYHIFRDGGQIKNTASTTLRDNGLTLNTIYSYAAEAYDAAGNVSVQTTVNARTLATAPATSTSYQNISTIVPPPIWPAITTTSVAISATTTTQGPFVVALSFGSRGENVVALQLFLIRKAYLGPEYATGFFGSLTQKAVQKFQCDQGIICSGNPSVTGWGAIGPRTRKVLNALQ